MKPMYQSREVDFHRLVLLDLPRGGYSIRRKSRFYADF
jgi:hypothetical protein